MNRRIYPWAISLLLLSMGSASAYQDRKHFGDQFTNAKTVKLEKLMANASKYANTQVKVEGKIKDVCQAKGCWLVITDGNREMRVSFKAYSFFVPKDSSGKKVVLEGQIAKETITEEEARHYAQESKGKIDPASIKGPQEVVTMIATAVRID